MGGLAFLSPLYLLGALAIALPIALHLFRRRTETVVDFPAVRLLAHTPVEQQRRRRLRELILLALRVSALVLLAGSFARPYLAGSVLAGDTPVTVVALDTSFSMAAPGVFDRARAAAVAALDTAPSGHAVSLVTFDDGATTVVAPTTDRSAARAAVASVVPGALPTRFGAAVARAAEVIGGRQGRLVVVTDAQQSGWDGPARGGLGADIEVVVASVEGARHNVAVVSAERRGGGPAPVRVEAAVHNFGLEQRDVPVTLTVDGREVAQATVTVPPRLAVPVRFDTSVPASGGATVAIVDADGIPADDRRHLRLEPSATARVTVVVADPSGRGGLYVERALGVADGNGAFEVTVVDGRAFSAWTAEEVGREQALVVLGTRTLDRQGRAHVARVVAGGGALLLAMGPDTDPGTLADVLGRDAGVGPDVVTTPGAGATLVAADARHPVFRRFATPATALGDIAFSRYRPVDEAGRIVLARFSGGAPALLEQSGAGRVLLFASDLDNVWNRFPLSPAFVPFVVETTRYLTEGRRAPTSWVLPSAPPGVPPQPGLVSAEATGDRAVAINVDTVESNPWPMTADSFVEAVPRVARAVTADPEADARKAEREQRLWQLGLLAMFVALAGEGLVGRRAG